MICCSVRCLNRTFGERVRPRTLVNAPRVHELSCPSLRVSCSVAETDFSAETLTEENEDSEKAAKLDLFANIFVSFVAFVKRSGETPGSARVSRAGDGVVVIANFLTRSLPPGSQRSRSLNKFSYMCFMSFVVTLRCDSAET